jgi:hypothetical protein
MNIKQHKHILLLSLIVSTSLYSGNVFSIDVKNDTSQDRFIHNTSDLTNLLDTFDTDQLSSRFNYTETDQIIANLDFRGLPMGLKFSTNSNILELQIPSLDIKESFNGQNREASIRLLEDWFKNNKQNVEKIMKELARVSPVDPIAGNPNSLMATMVGDDFMNGFQKVATQQKGMGSKNFLLIAPVFKSLDIDGKKSDNFILPLGYSFAVGDDPKETVSFSLPLSYVSVEGAKSYNVGLGVAYSLPITDSWIITPSIKYSLVGSKNLGTLAQMASGSLTSSYTWDLGNRHALSFGNMIGHYATVKFYDADYAFNPHIANTVFRNAIMYSLPSDKIYKNTSVDFFVIDTQYTGTELYLESYDEIGLSFGFNKDVMNLTAEADNYEYDSELKLGVSYLTSSKADGFEINFGYSF